MSNVVNFNMIVEINQLLKEKGIDYTIHAVGGCTCCGLELRQNGKRQDIQEIIDIINQYLQSKWMKVKQNSENEMMLNVESKFEFEM